ncbi:hypothetical protein TWF718_003538 [Orbilia javanica]|uniref:Uncharacterized protein n=1 Tax=Orbilia javanica TaxID=47235 RepID=A0AAN8MLC3_9PEZI
MGQLFSTRSRYAYITPDKPPPDLPDSFFIDDTNGSEDGIFYVNFSDPGSLVRELRRHHMAGVLIVLNCDGDGGPEPAKGDLYLIDWDDMPTSIVADWPDILISAVYPAELSHLATLSVGGEALA